MSDRNQVLARTAIAVSVVSVSGCFLLTKRFGAVGGMQAMVIGQILNVAIPLMALNRRVVLPWESD